MTRKKFFTLALTGLAAALCLSAKAAPASEELLDEAVQDEVAMAKCSKDKGDKPCKPNGKGNGRTMCKSRKNGSNPQKQSAAQKVVQGS